MQASKPENVKRTVVKIGGMHCAGCVTAIQGYVSDIAGVRKVEVNLASEKAILEYDPSQVSLGSVEKAIEEVGYKIVYEKLVLKVSGISDSSDAYKIENALRQTEGIRSASVNYGTSQINVEYNPALLSTSDVRRKISEFGYEVISEASGESAIDAEAGKLKRLFFIGLAFTIPVLIYSYPEIFKIVPLASTSAAAYIAFACAAIVQFVTGSRFYVGAFRIARMKSANMDTLIVLGTTTAFVFSAYNTFPLPRWDGIYYDAAAVVVTFILLGKYLELKTKGRTSSVIRKMLELQPKTATIRKEDGSEAQVSVELIQPGDIVVVKPGEKIPVDSKIIMGSSAIDESMVTGESMPVSKKVGESAIGGTINKEGMILVKASKVGSESYISQVVRLVEDAMGRKPPMQKLVDRAAGYFAYIVMIAALSTFLVWYLLVSHGITGASIIPAVAILVVACPCALGLATPTAIMVGMGKGASNGAIFKSGEAMEMLNKISVAIFDKTGTLTQGKPEVTDFVQVAELASIAGDKSANSNVLLEIVAAVEKGSEHPLAKAIVAYAVSKGVSLSKIDAQEFRSIPGRGIDAKYLGMSVKVGSPSFMLDQNIDISSSGSSIEKLQEQGKTVVIVSVDNRTVGIIGLLDVPKAGAKGALSTIKSLGIEPVMLTGDNEKTAREIARNLGIDRVFANVLPEGKVQVISDLQKGGTKVAMIGDGVNDAPALTTADVGIAIGSGTDVAIEAGNVVLIRDDIGDVVAAIEIAKKTISKVRQNLIYAFAYNVILIPIAATGLLYPALAGVAMAASSVSVTSSSLLLKRWRPRKA